MLNRVILVLTTLVATLVGFTVQADMHSTTMQRATIMTLQFDQKPVAEGAWELSYTVSLTPRVKLGKYFKIDIGFDNIDEFRPKHYQLDSTDKNQYHNLRVDEKIKLATELSLSSRKSRSAGYTLPALKYVSSCDLTWRGLSYSCKIDEKGHVTVAHALSSISFNKFGEETVRLLSHNGDYFQQGRRDNKLYRKSASLGALITIKAYKGSEKYDGLQPKVTVTFYSKMNKRYFRVQSESNYQRQFIADMADNRRQETQFYLIGHPDGRVSFQSTESRLFLTHRKMWGDVRMVGSAKEIGKDEKFNLSGPIIGSKSLKEGKWSLTLQDGNKPIKIGRDSKFYANSAGSKNPAWLFIEYADEEHNKFNQVTLRSVDNDRYVRTQSRSNYRQQLVADIAKPRIGGRDLLYRMVKNDDGTYSIYSDSANQYVIGWNSYWGDVRLAAGGTNKPGKMRFILKRFGNGIGNPAAIRLPAEGAKQSSVSHRGKAARAIDGNTDGRYKSNSVTHTKAGRKQPWWSAKVKDGSEIDFIDVYNRSDCCSERLRDFYVFFSPEPFKIGVTLEKLLRDKSVSRLYHKGNASRLERFSVQDENYGQFDVRTRYRYVRIQLTENAPLSLAEVEFWGTKSIYK